MAILLICGTNHEEVKAQQWFIEDWKKALRQADPDIDVRIWPNTGDAKDIVFGLVWKYKPGELKHYPNLKCIASLGGTVDHIINDPDKPASVPIVKIIDKTMATDITQYVVGATLNYVRRFDHWKNKQEKKMWDKRPPFHFSQRQVGIMGLGYLGQKAATALAQLGLRVTGWSRHKKNMDAIQCFHGDNELEIFLSQADILICMLPLTQATKNLLNKSTLGQLPYGAYLINISRGELLVEKDLLEALASGQISGAVLDVFQEEPLPQDHPFWTHPKIKITPHIASMTNAAVVASQITDNYHRALRGLALVNKVDVKRGY